MVHQSAAIGKTFAAHIARHRFVAMRLHVPLEPCFIVKCFATLQAGVILLFGMVPGVFHERAFVFTVFAAHATGRASQLLFMYGGNMLSDFIIVCE